MIHNLMKKRMVQATKQQKMSLQYQKILISLTLSRSGCTSFLCTEM